MQNFTPLKGLLLNVVLLLFASGLHAQADLSLSILQQANTPAQYTLYAVTTTINNAGPDSATNVVVQIPLPNGVVYESGNEFAASIGTFEPYNNSNWTIPTLNAGDSATIVLNYFLLEPSTPGVYAQVTASDQVDTDSTPGNGMPPATFEDDEASTLINGGFVPDLTLGNLTLTPDTIEVGEQLDYTFDLINLGAGSVGQSFLIQSYLSVDNSISLDDLQNGTVLTSNFQSNQIATDIAGISIPTGLAPGNYFLLLFADANGQVVESNEFNNITSVPFTIVAPVAPPTNDSIDLSVAIAQTVTDPTQGTSYSVLASITNAGPGLATGVVLDLPKPASVSYQVGNEALASAGSFDFASATPGTWTVDSLAAGDTATLTINYIVQTQPVSGSYVQVVAANEPDTDSTPGNGTPPTAFEDDEATTLINNGFVPDLTLANLALLETTISVGEQLDYTFDIINLGSGSISQDFLVQAYLSADDSISLDDLQNGTVLTSNIQPLQISAGVVGVSIPTGLAPGAYNLILFADANNNVVEISELNNLISVPFTIADSIITPVGDSIDLSVSISRSVADPLQYTLFSVTALVTNAGPAVATGVVVDLPKPANLVYEGGNEATVSQGTFNTYSAPIGEWAVGTIAAGDTASITINYYVLAQPVSGSYIQVLAANEDDVDSTPGNGNPPTAFEDDEATTLVNGGFVPDLTLQKLALVNDTITVGEQLDYTFDLVNLGAGSVGQNFLVQAYLSTDNVISLDDLQNGTVLSSNFQPFQTATGVVGVSIPTGLAPGNYFLILFADANGQVVEASELNNTISVPFVIEASSVQPCTLVASVLSVDCDDQGTPSAADDTYAATILVDNSAANGSYTATVGSIVMSGDYGTPLVVQGGTIAAATGLTIILTDAADSTCSDTLAVPAITVGCSTPTPPTSTKSIDLKLVAFSSSTAPQIYTVTSVMFTLTNTGVDTATGVIVDAPLPANTVYTGGNEFVASQGTLSLFGATINQWNVGSLAPGATANLVINYFSLSNTGYPVYAEVLAANETDTDSTPGNGTGISAKEDDEVFLNLTFTARAAIRMNIAPNPAEQGDRVVLRYESSGDAEVPLIISDLLGREVLRTSVRFNEGWNEVPVNLRSLRSGIYVLAMPDTGLRPERLVIE